MRITEHLVNDGVLRLAVAGELDLASADTLFDTVGTLDRLTGVRALV
jgi:hypothetical protein